MKLSDVTDASTAQGANPDAGLTSLKRGSPDSTTGAEWTAKASCERCFPFSLLDVKNGQCKEATLRVVETEDVTHGMELLPLVSYWQCQVSKSHIPVVGGGEIASSSSQVFKDKQAKRVCSLDRFAEGTEGNMTLLASV